MNGTTIELCKIIAEMAVKAAILDEVCEMIAATPKGLKESLCATLEYNKASHQIEKQLDEAREAHKAASEAAGRWMKLHDAQVDKCNNCEMHDIAEINASKNRLMSELEKEREAFKDLQEAAQRSAARAALFERHYRDIATMAENKSYSKENIMHAIKAAGI